MKRLFINNKAEKKSKTLLELIDDESYTSLSYQELSCLKGGEDENEENSDVSLG